MRRVIAQAGLVVMVAYRGDDGLSFLGSGVLCSPDGHVLTCLHILDLSKDLCIVIPPPIDEYAPITSTGSVTAHSVLVAQVDADHDIAILKIRGGAIVEINMNSYFKNDSDIDVGEDVACIGLPFANRGLHTLKVTKTIICGKSKNGSGSKRIHLDANCHQGNSGGPIFNIRAGRIVGLLAGRFNPIGSEGGIFIGDYPLGIESTISFAIPIEYGLNLMRQEGINV